MTALLRSPKTARLFGKAALKAAYKEAGIAAPRDEREFRLQCGLADALRDECQPDIYWTAIPMGEYRPGQTGERVKRMGGRRGAPDLEFCIIGRMHGLELKAKGGVHSDDQKAAGALLEAAGGVYAVATGWDEAVSVLKLWGVLPPDFESERCKQLYLPLEAA